MCLHDLFSELGWRRCPAKVAAGGMWRRQSAPAGMAHLAPISQTLLTPTLVIRVARLLN